MATAGDLVKGAMRLIGAIASGETPTSAEMSDGLSVLNEMIKSWSNDNLVVYQRPREVFSLVGGQQNYLMGSGQDFDSSRPTEITGIGVLRNGQEIPVHLLTADQWEKVTLKDLNQSFPTAAYCEVEGENLSIYFWPIPTDSDSVIVYSRKPFASFAAQSDVVLLADGYFRALRYNLALELAPEFGIEPSQLVYGIAKDSLAKIKRQNLKPPILAKEDPINGNSYIDWRTGEVK